MKVAVILACLLQVSLARRLEQQPDAAAPLLPVEGSCSRQNTTVSPDTCARSLLVRVAADDEAPIAALKLGQFPHAEGVAVEVSVHFITADMQAGGSRFLGNVGYRVPIIPLTPVVREPGYLSITMLGGPACVPADSAGPAVATCTTFDNVVTPCAPDLRLICQEP